MTDRTETRYAVVWKGMLTYSNRDQYLRDKPYGGFINWDHHNCETKLWKTERGANNRASQYGRREVRAQKVEVTLNKYGRVTDVRKDWN